MVPIKNQKMRVISESLEIKPLDKPACYDIVIPKSALSKAGEPVDGALAENGAPVKCAADHDFDTTLIAKLD